jgi:hypothetical protein
MIPMHTLNSVIFSCTTIKIISLHDRSEVRQGGAAPSALEDSTAQFQINTKKTINVNIDIYRLTKSTRQLAVGT